MSYRPLFSFLLCLLSWTVASSFVITEAPRSSLPKEASISRLAAYKPNLPNFCSECGSANMELRIPDGDDHLRAVCQDCEAVVYVNPKVVIACVILTEDKGKVLLAQRAIEPRAGFWGIPQGYMELDETTRQAVCREVREETGAEILEDQLRFRAVYNVPGSVQLVYSASVSEEDLKVAETTMESTAIGFYPLDELPDLCFPTVQWAIDHCRANSQDIQQKNKMHNADSGEWSESEDKDAQM